MTYKASVIKINKNEREVAFIKGNEVKGVTRVYSHKMAVEQVAKWQARYGNMRVSWYGFES